MEESPRPTTFDETLATADRELARLQQAALEAREAQRHKEEDRQAAITARERDQRRALACAGFGVVWQLGAHHPWIVSLPGTVLVVAGCAYWARSKGWHPALGLLGAVPFLGLLVVGLFPDRLRRRLMVWP